MQKKNYFTNQVKVIILYEYTYLYFNKALFICLNDFYMQSSQTTGDRGPSFDNTSISVALTKSY